MQRDKAMQSVSRKFKPPVKNFILYCVACLAIPITLVLPIYFIPITLLAMICVHHGTHEAVHGTLYPAKGRHSKANLLFGSIGFANFGHNFIFLKWSHMAHHRYGRSRGDEFYTLDGEFAKSGKRGKLWYYASLFGQACVVHEIASYLYLLNGKFHLVTRKFPRSCHENPSYWSIQAATFLYTVFLFGIAGWHFVLCRLLFTMYWGAFQNTAHYGLDYGHPDDRLASRTYRVARWYEGLIFRSGTYHLEHHVLPSVPGPCLNAPEVQQEVARILGFKPTPVRGLLNYWKDCLAQFKGTRANGELPLPWKTSTSVKTVSSVAGPAH